MYLWTFIPSHEFSQVLFLFKTLFKIFPTSLILQHREFLIIVRDFSKTTISSHSISRNIGNYFDILDRYKIKVRMNSLKFILYLRLLFNVVHKLQL